MNTIGVRPFSTARSTSCRSPSGSGRSSAVEPRCGFLFVPVPASGYHRPTQPDPEFFTFIAATGSTSHSFDIRSGMTRALETRAGHLDTQGNNHLKFYTLSGTSRPWGGRVRRSGSSARTRHHSCGTQRGSVRPSGRPARGQRSGQRSTRRSART
jgi:hypothetical protein